jgi:hypothetical protein
MRPARKGIGILMGPGAASVFTFTRVTWRYESASVAHHSHAHLGDVRLAADVGHAEKVFGWVEAPSLNARSGQCERWTRRNRRWVASLDPEAPCSPDGRVLHRRGLSFVVESRSDVGTEGRGTMVGGPCYSPNRDEIVAKVLDGEAIMINLSKGIYYSLDGVGGRVWELLEEGRGAADVAAGIVREFDVTLERARSDVERILRELLAENVVRLEPGGASVSSESASCAGLGAKRPYREPKLTVYRDMADLLDLEPPTPGAAQEDLWESAR